MSAMQKAANVRQWTQKRDARIARGVAKRREMRKWFNTYYSQGVDIPWTVRKSWMDFQTKECREMAEESKHLHTKKYRQLIQEEAFQREYHTDWRTAPLPTWRDKVRSYIPPVDPQQIWFRVDKLPARMTLFINLDYDERDDDFVFAEDLPTNALPASCTEAAVRSDL